MKWIAGMYNVLSFLPEWSWVLGRVPVIVVLLNMSYKYICGGGGGGIITTN